MSDSPTNSSAAPQLILLKQQNISSSTNTKETMQCNAVFADCISSYYGPHCNVSSAPARSAQPRGPAPCPKVSGLNCLFEVNGKKQSSRDPLCLWWTIDIEKSIELDRFAMEFYLGHAQKIVKPASAKKELGLHLRWSCGRPDVLLVASIRVQCDGS